MGQNVEGVSPPPTNRGGTRGKKADKGVLGGKDSESWSKTVTNQNGGKRERKHGDQKLCKKLEIQG